ncbi:MAG: tetratricopeptide repeat protein [Terriglobia bacterium]
MSLQGSASGPHEEDQSGLEEIARRERLLKIGLITVGIALVAVIAFLLFSFVAARTGRPGSIYEFQLDRVNFWEKTVREDPGSSSNHTNLGLAYLKIGRDQRAIAEFKSAIKYDRENADPYMHLGRYYFDRGQNERAIPFFTNAARHSPGRSRSYSLFKLGEIYEEEQDNEKALDFFLKASREEPLMWNAHYKIGAIYEKIGKNDLALAEYEEAARFNPENRDVQKAIERLTR